MKPEVTKELRLLMDQVSAIVKENNLNLVCYIGEENFLMNCLDPERMLTIVQGENNNLNLGIQLLIGMVANNLSEDNLKIYRRIWQQFGSSEFDATYELAEALLNGVDDDQDERKTK